MKNTDYDNLTKSLERLTKAANLLRDAPRVTIVHGEDEPKTIMGHIAGINPYLFVHRVSKGIDRAIELATEAVNDYTTDSKNLAPRTISDLSQAQQLFLSTTNTPIEHEGFKGLNGLFDRLRDIVERIPISPVKYYPAFVRSLIENPKYNEAIENGDITPPFEWNGTIQDLARFVDNRLAEFEPNTFNSPWRYADELFTKNGSPVTKKQLKKAYHRPIKKV
ncbi:MAG: hypothetical protein J5699_00850 [Bacteroidales bacterium]|nr:hypothetical protein [Bacteroidales bacterium]